MEKVLNTLPDGFVIRGAIAQPQGLPEGFVIRGDKPAPQQVPGIDAPQPYAEALGDRLMNTRDNVVAQFTEPYAKDKTAGPDLLQRIGDAGGRIANTAMSPVMAAMDMGAAGLQTQVTQPIARQFVGPETTLEQKQKLAQVSGDTADLGTQAFLAPTPIKKGGSIALRPGMTDLPKAMDGFAEGAAQHYKVDRALKPKSPLTAEQVKTASRGAYKAAEESGGVLNGNFSTRAINILDSYKPKPIAGKVLTSENAEIANALDEFKDLRGSNLTLTDYQQIDAALGDKVAQAYVSGNMNKGRVLGKAQDDIRQLLDSVSESEVIGGKQGFDILTKEAIPTWSVQSKMNDLERIVQRANMMDNPSTGVRTGFRNLSLNQKKMASYPKEVQRLISKAAVTGKADDLLGILGSRLNPIVAGAVGGPIGMAASAATSGLFRGIRTGLKNNQADRIISKVAEPIRPIVERYNAPKTPPKAQGPMLALPAPKTVVSVDSAGRATPPLSPAGRESLGIQAPQFSRALLSAPKADTSAFSAAWESFTAEQQAQIGKQIERAWASQQMPLSEIILEARKAADEIASIKGDVKNPAMREALTEAVRQPTMKEVMKMKPAAAKKALENYKTNRK